MKKKAIVITSSIIIMISLFAGCGELSEEAQAEKIRRVGIKTDKGNGQVLGDESEGVDRLTGEAAIGKEQEAAVGKEQEAAVVKEQEVAVDKEQESAVGKEQEVTADKVRESVSEDRVQAESCIEPTEVHDKQMLALLDETCDSRIYAYTSVDMDKDGEYEMIGVAYDNFSIWYCSSDFEDCYMVSDGPSYRYDDCTIVQIEFDEERHVVIDTYNTFGTAKSYSILALHDGGIEILVNNNYGYVYMNEKNDIILDVEAYDGEYDKIYKSWSTHTWTDTYLYYEDGRYKEYGAAVLSEKDFFKYDNAKELLDEIEKENWDENVLEIHYTYFVRENGIVHIQCEEEQNECIVYYHYTFRENKNRLDVEMFQNYGIMYSSLSQLDEVTYP